MTLQLAKHEKILLRNHPDFSESWLHDRICEDTGILGLGELDVIQRERPQFSGGRLDMLLGDTESNTRYEVEVMLGATDPNHIVRSVEYWDIERRRYPAYEHIAVLVAENVTNRFLNFMALLSGSIPLIAIQLDALRVGDCIVLNFVKVLDQRDLRDEDGLETDGQDVDRQWWESRKGMAILKLCDRILAIANEKSDPPLQLRYKKTAIGISTPGSFFHAVRLFPKKSFLRLRVGVSNASMWIEKLEGVGLEAHSRADNRIGIRIDSEDFVKHENLLRELLQQAVEEFQA